MSDDVLGMIWLASLLAVPVCGGLIRSPEEKDYSVIKNTILLILMFFCFAYFFFIGPHIVM